MYYKKYLNDFLYLTCFDDLDYKHAFEHFKQFKLPSTMGCSVIDSGQFVGRNFDWYYDEYPEAIVITKPDVKRNATIGVAKLSGSMTRTNMKNGVVSEEALSLIPFLTVDCMNKDIYCSINVVPSGDKEGSSPVGSGPDICQLMLPRLICDSANSIDEAIALINSYTIYAPLAQKNVECHLYISDRLDSAVVEFANGEINVIENKKILTNFYLTDWSGVIASAALGSDEVEIEASCLTDHAQGLERYLYLQSVLFGIETEEDMIDTMKAVAYSKAYDINTSPFWYSEFYGETETFGDLTIYNTAEEMQPIVEYAINEFNKHERNSKSWITTHTSIYDKANNKLMVFCQENYNEPFIFSLEDLPRYGVENLSDAFSAFKSI